VPNPKTYYVNTYKDYSEPEQPCYKTTVCQSLDEATFDARNNYTKSLQYKCTNVVQQTDIGLLTVCTFRLDN
jgi:hypothetical protein